MEEDPTIIDLLSATELSLSTMWPEAATLAAAFFMSQLLQHNLFWPAGFALKFDSMARTAHTVDIPPDQTPGAAGPNLISDQSPGTATFYSFRASTAKGESP
jgi:hypothetical protein